MGRGEEKEKCLSAPVFGNVSTVLFRWAANKQWIKNDNVGVYIHKRNELHNSATANHMWTRLCFFTNSTNCSGVPASTNDRITEERMYEHGQPYDFLSNPHCYYIKHRAENLKNPPPHPFIHFSTSRWGPSCLIFHNWQSEGNYYLRCAVGLNVSLFAGLLAHMR